MTEVKEPRDTSRCEFDSEGFCGVPKKTKDKMPDAPLRKLETAPFDPRFPNQNQTRYCYQSFVDFHRCHKLKGDDYQPCDYFKKVYQSMCPAAWVEKWDTQIDEGRFPGRI